MGQTSLDLASARDLVRSIEGARLAEGNSSACGDDGRRAVFVVSAAGEVIRLPYDDCGFLTLPTGRIVVLRGLPYL